MRFLLLKIIYNLFNCFISSLSCRAQRSTLYKASNLELFIMYELKTEILEICEAFNLGSFISMETYKSNCKGFILSLFKTTQGNFKHYYKIK